MITNLYKKSMLKVLASGSFILLMTANFLFVTEIVLFALKNQKNFQVKILYFFIISLFTAFFFVITYTNSEKNS